jgi:hypothetical protein
MRWRSTLGSLQRARTSGHELIREKLGNNELARVHLNFHALFRSELKLSKKQKSGRIFVEAAASRCLDSLKLAVAQTLGTAADDLVLTVGPRGGATHPLTTDAALASAWTRIENATLNLNVDPIRPDWRAPAKGEESGNYAETAPILFPETQAMQMLSFYSFREIKDPITFCETLRATWAPLGAMGRVYVGFEGVNAQMAVPDATMDAFRDATGALAQLETTLNLDNVVPIQEVWHVTARFFRPNPPASTLLYRLRAVRAVPPISGLAHSAARADRERRLGGTA